MKLKSKDFPYFGYFKKFKKPIFFIKKLRKKLAIL